MNSKVPQRLREGTSTTDGFQLMRAFLLPRVDLHDHLSAAAEFANPIALSLESQEVVVSAEKSTLTRVQLYEKVWAKLCRRHEIPLPGRGYWTRIQFGQKPGRLRYPTLRILDSKRSRSSPVKDLPRKSIILGRNSISRKSWFIPTDPCRIVS
jgi:hypothetical protein